MEEIKGDLIKLAKEGKFDIIAHGCNCFVRMGRGIAPQIKEAFPDAWKADQKTKSGDFNKLGNYSVATIFISEFKTLKVLNVYSQYGNNPADKPLDYDALTLALRKINKAYPDHHIGLPQIGSGLAGGDWNRIKSIIEKELSDMFVTIVYYDKNF